jgi:hypothetical protein
VLAADGSPAGKANTALIAELEHFNRDRKVVGGPPIIN